MIVLSEPDGATPLDPDELAGIRFRHITTRGELDELEQVNIEEGLLWLSARNRGDILSDGLVRELHRRLFGQVWTWAGTYRATEKNIGVDPLHIAVQLRHLLDDAGHWHEHRVFTPLEAAARFHHRLVQIHPFANGNGRHARIAADLFPTQYFDHPPIDWLAGQDLQSAGVRRAQYIAALRAADGHDFAPLLEFVGLP